MREKKSGEELTIRINCKEDATGITKEIILVAP